MTDGGGGAGTLETLHNALEAVKVLRCNVGGFFETVAGGVKSDSTGSTEDREKLFRIELQGCIHKIFENLREVDSQVASLTPPIGSSFNLGNTMFINQEVSQDRIPLYSELVDSYKWMEKVHEYSGIAGPILGQNSLKRTYFSASLNAKRRRTIASSYVVPPQSVDNSIQAIAHSYKDMEINITRPLGSNAALCITLGRTLKAVVILKGWLIEWVVVRAANEDMTKEDGTLDLWGESRYKVFQKVTDNANAAMLHFCAPTHPELSVRSFMTWLHSFITLFTQPCKKCGLHLSNNMPPTWRDLRTLEPFHEECKP